MRQSFEHGRTETVPYNPKHLLSCETFHMATIDNLVDDFSAMLSEAEDLLKRSDQESGDTARELRSEVEAKLLHARLRLQELEGQAVDTAKAAHKAADDYVHAKPWQAIGLAAAAGLVLGLLISRR